MRRKWPRAAFLDFLFQRFLLPASLRWFDSSPCTSERSHFQLLLKHIPKLVDPQKRLIAAIARSRCAYALPTSFTSVKQHFFLCYLEVNDVKLLAELLSSSGLLPTSVSLSDFTDRCIENTRFWCQVFPDGGRRRQSRVSWSVSGWAGGQELKIEQIRRFGELWEFEELISKEVDKLMSRDVRLLNKLPITLLSHELKQLVMLAGLDQSLIQPFCPLLDRIADSWDRIAKSGNQNGKMDELLGKRKRVRYMVYEAISMMSYVHRGPLSRTFGFIMTQMKQIYDLMRIGGMGIDFIVEFLARIPGRAVIVPYVIVNSTLAYEDGFLDERERLAWLTFEAGLMKVLGSDPGVIELLGELEGEVRKQCYA
jgi:hypothetical protein